MPPGERGALEQLTIADRLFGSGPSAAAHKWPTRHPEVAASMAWLVIVWEEEQGSAAPGRRAPGRGD